MARRRRGVPRCQYGRWWHNKLTRQRGWIQCGGPGTNRYQMCSEAGEHPRAPGEVDEKTGWPVLTGGWTVEQEQDEWVVD